MGIPRKNIVPEKIIPDYEQILSCMHCGMCLPTCPTYELTGLEKESPRGRIRMIKAVAEGDLKISKSYVESLENCLDCQACVTACPAGVPYGKLIEAARYQIYDFYETQHANSLLKKLLLTWLFSRQTRLKVLRALVYLYQLSGLKTLTRRFKLLRPFSTRMQQLHGLLPTVRPYRPYAHSKLQQVEEKPKIKVGLISGCVQDIFFNHVNHDTIEVLEKNNYSVFVPTGQNCCGSVMGHNGNASAAKQASRDIIDLFYNQVDYVIINSAGCGSFMKSYDTLLENEPVYAPKALWMASHTKDIMEFLDELGFTAPKTPFKKRVTYHEPCHLVHAQKISEAPRHIIKKLPGVEFIELPESSWCCGSAGVYNVTHFENSMQLLNRKMDNLKSTKADLVLTGNPGCLIQLSYGKTRNKAEIDVQHPVSLINEMYKNDLTETNK